MNTRRHFIKNAMSLGGLLLGGAFIFSGCGDGQKPAATKDKKPTSCSDLSGISAEEKDKRKKLGYVEKSPIPDSKCGNCKLYLPPGKDEHCGSCSLFKGPIEVEGYCTYYAPLTEGE
ncbi:high-potential iron-sulfur protein [Chitinophaga niabensis]|uniref:high-potential iron-sulfur protein n=1 Tax=Chitinophaga niabensis TaxID=536979 RepID=UPI0031BB89AE